ncbi:MAG: protein translocase subunit SecD, partial [Phycisphaerae bacterium]
MNEDRKLFKWSLVIFPVVVAILAIYPPSQKLKAGIDLAGGSSLLFEIDTKGLSRSEQTGLADRVMRVLKRRVDPNGQLNLVWRPIGNNRLEIQMPRPPRLALERRKAYDAARAELAALNVSRLELEAMLNSPPDERPARRQQLIRGVGLREALMDSVIEAYDAYRDARQGLDLSAEDAARAAYESALGRLLETSVDLGRFKDILALADEAERDQALLELKNSHPSPKFAAAIDATVEKYDAWAQDKGVLEDPSDLKRRIRGAGVLEFRMIAERDLASPGTTTHAEAYLQEPIGRYQTQLQERGPRTRPGDNYQWLEVSDIVGFMNADNMEDVKRIKEGSQSQVIIEEYAGKWYVLAHAEKKFGLLRERKWKLVSAFVGVDSQSGGPAVNFVLDPRGGRLFADLTGSNIGRPMAIILDNQCQSFATIQSMIRENGQITSSSFTQDEVNEMVATLRAGSLPARLIETPLMEQTIGPQLGEYNRTLGMRATVIGFVAVALFMIIYYRFAGLVADLALVMNLLFVLGIMAAMQATFTLPGIAGLILTVGMAVDANVLIFERIREERDRGVGMRKALRVGYERAFSTIVDANLTTIIICIVLGYLGTEEVKGFAMVLGFGVATSMFTSLFVTRLIFTTLLKAGWIKTLTMMRLLQRPKIDWLGLRRVFWPVSCGVVVLALAFAVTLSTTDKEALYDIEFLGGTSVQFELKEGESLNDQEARQLVSSLDADSGSVVQWLRNTAAPAIEAASVAPASAAGSFTISSDVLSGEQIEALVRRTLEPSVERGGFTRASRALTIDAKPEAMLDVDKIRSALAGAADDADKAAAHLANARIQTVRELEAAADAPPAFEVITVETNKALVKTAILAVLADRLNISRAVSFTVVTDPKIAPAGYWPIEEEVVYLSDVIEDPTANYDIRPYKGGVAIVLDELEPPISIKDFESRLRGIRLQPE